MTSNYLAGISEDDNELIVDGKYYTEMEHHWDEAYGYFTDATTTQQMELIDFGVNMPINLI